MFFAHQASYEVEQAALEVAQQKDAEAALYRATALGALAFSGEEKEGSPLPSPDDNKTINCVFLPIKLSTNYLQRHHALGWCACAFAFSGAPLHMIEDENMQQNVAASAIQSRWRAAKNKTDNRKRGAGGRRAGVAAEAVNFKLDYGVPVDEQVRDRRKWTVFSSKRSRFAFGKAISFYQDRLGTNSKREEL